MGKENNLPETRLSVRLKGPLAAFANRRVETHLYESHSEYVRDLIRRDMAHEEEYDLREGLVRGYADIAAGRFTTMTNDEIFDEAMQELREEGYDTPAGP